MNQLTAWMNNHQLILLLILGTSVSALWLILMRKRLKIHWWTAVVLGIAHTLLGVFFVKAFAFMESGFDADSLGSMSLFGGVFFMPLTYLLGARVFKRPLKEVTDIFTPAMIVTLLCARVNCILAGCCQGLLIPGAGGIRFPTRETEIVFYLILLILLCPKVWRKQTNGKAYPIYMMAYGTFRFLVEFFRDQNTTSLLHLSHLWAVVSFCIGVSIYAEINQTKNLKKREANK